MSQPGDERVQLTDEEVDVRLVRTASGSLHKRPLSISELPENSTTPISGSLSDLSALGPAFTEGTMCDLLGVEAEQLKVMPVDGPSDRRPLIRSMQPKVRCDV